MSFFYLYINLDSLRAKKFSSCIQPYSETFSNLIDIEANHGKLTQTSIRTELWANGEEVLE